MIPPINTPSLWDTLPATVISQEICRLLRPQDKCSLSMVNKRTYELYLQSVERVDILWPYEYKKIPETVPADILLKAVSRYQHLRDISFGKITNNYVFGRRVDQFDENSEKFLMPLVNYLNQNPHPWLNVKKITFYDIRFHGRDKNELNTLCLNAFCHFNVTDLNIDFESYFSYDSSCLSKLQPLLDSLSNLESFCIRGSSYTRKLSLDKQSRLTTAQFKFYSGSTETLTSLKQCTQLENLVIDNITYPGRIEEASNIYSLWTTKNLWPNLKRLVFGEFIKTDNDLFNLTLQLPNLEYLEIKFMDVISKVGMEHLGKNCKKLKYLHLYHGNGTDETIGELTRHLPDLEVLTYNSASKITGNGISEIAKNCPKLRALSFIYCKNIDEAGIQSLEQCQQLCSIKLMGITFPMPALRSLVAKLPHLVNVTIRKRSEAQEHADDADFDDYEEFDRFERDFPHLSNGPWDLYDQRMHLKDRVQFLPFI